MTEVHVHETADPVIVDSASDRSAAAGINMITVLIVLAVLVIGAWFLFSGPLHSVATSTPGAGTSSSTTINNNPPAQSQPNVNVAPNVNVNPPSGTTSGSGSSTGSSSSNTTGNTTTGAGH